MRRWLQWVPLAAALGWLLLDGRRFFLDEAQYLVEILLVTFVTRSVGARLGLSALAWGMGLVAPLTVGIGAALAAVGLDMRDGSGNGLIVPLVEESLKLLPIGIVAAIAGRWKPRLLNPSDLLLLGSMSGAGFSLVESAYFDGVRTGERYGPHLAGINLLPTAWGEAGYIGHAAATGFIALGLGLALYAMRRRPTARWWWALPVAVFGWITLEHSLANLYMNTGSSGLLALGGGRVTPWLLLAGIAAAIVVDARSAFATFGRSKELQKRRVMVSAFLSRQWRTRQWPPPRAVFALIGQLRQMNAAAWFDAGRRATTATEPAP